MISGSGSYCFVRLRARRLRIVGGVGGVVVVSMSSDRVVDGGNGNNIRYIPPHLRRPEGAQPPLPPPSMNSDRGAANAFSRGRGASRVPYMGRGSDSGFANEYQKQRSSAPYRGRFSYDRRCAIEFSF